MMSTYNIFYHKKSKRMMKYDSKLKSIMWERNISNTRLSSNFIRELNSVIAEDIYSKESDIEIVKIDKNNFLTRNKNKNGYVLYNGNKHLGILDITFGPTKINEFKQHGGLIIRFQEDSDYRIVYYRIAEQNKLKPDNNDEKDKINNYKEKKLNEKNIAQNDVLNNYQRSFFDQSNDISRNKGAESEENEYYETTIKIPISKLKPKDTKIEKLLHISELIYDKVNNLDNKLKKVENNNDSSQVLRYKNMYTSITVENNELKKSIYHLKKENGQLTEDLNSIVNERKFLLNEIEKAKLVALNELKSKLKPAIVNINTQIDLDQKRRIYDEVLDIIKLFTPESDYEKIIKNKEINTKIKEFSDNIDTKILVLQEIKELFENIGLSTSNRGDE